MTNSEARFTINVRDGMVELEGKESFVDKHLEKFEEIFKMAVKEAITRGVEQSLESAACPDCAPFGTVATQGDSCCD